MKEKDENNENNECNCCHGKCPQCGSRHEQGPAPNRSEDTPFDDDTDYGASGGGCPVGGAGFAFSAYGILL